MRPSGQRRGGAGRQVAFLAVALCTCIGARVAAQEEGAASSQAGAARLIGKEGTVDHQSAGRSWSPAVLNRWLALRDRLRTGELSRAAVRLSDLSVVRMRELTTIEILPPREDRPRPVLDLKQGSTYFFSREPGGEADIRTPVVTGALRGTEFHARVGPAGTTVLTVYEGAVLLHNEFGELLLGAGEQGTVDPGTAPRRTAVIQTRNIVQWCLYYPAVLNPAELDIAADERRVLAEVLDRYRKGDLLGALDAWPGGYAPRSRGGRAFQAGLVLSVGETELARGMVDELSKSDPATAAMVEVLAVARGERPADGPEPSTATGWLSASYAAQSRADLPAARRAAWRAVELDPEFGFAWARVAELAFSSGDRRETQQALDRALELSPFNAQAWTVLGFVELAEGPTDEAARCFETAIVLDPALSNAWLGRGLLRLQRERQDPWKFWCRRSGERSEALADLATAATVEPLRALPRSYLGKAFAVDGDYERAARELDGALRLDPADPTPYLYSALIHQRQHRIGAAVRELEKSVALNDNRRVYRSSLLLDQDRSIRQANLAGVYRDAGMSGYGLWAAQLAVQDDYANSSAHQFLAGAYDALRDPRRVQLRYESAWLNELLLANLLSAPGTAVLPRSVSNQEYSALAADEEPMLRVNSRFDSEGAQFHEGSVVERWGNGSAALEWNLLDDPGQRRNEDLQRSEYYLSLKQGLGCDTSLFLQMKFKDYESGDLFRYYDPTDASTSYRFEEDQDPLIWAGLARRWSPRHTSLTMLGHLVSQARASASEWPQVGFVRSGSFDGPVVFEGLVDTDFAYRETLSIDSVEHQHIWQGDAGYLLGGIRYQTGEIEVENEFGISPSDPLSGLPFAPAPARVAEDYRRLTGYAYGRWEATRNFALLAGLTWEDLEVPRNLRFRPLDRGTRSVRGWYPKVGFEWQLPGGIDVQGGAAMGTNGVSFENSLRLEPAQFGGFPQTWRTLVPGAAAGPLTAADYTLAGLSANGRLGDDTYWQIAGSWQRAEDHLQRGTLSIFAGSFAPTQSLEAIDYRETTVRASLNHLIGDCAAVGLDASWSSASLERRWLETSTLDLSGRRRARLWDLGAHLSYAHPSGWFGRLEARYLSQHNGWDDSSLPDDSFLHLNAWLGYRWKDPFVEASVGFLNLTDQDYRLNPLNYALEPPRGFRMVFQLKAAF